MEDDFDIGAAVDDIGSGLGFPVTKEDDDLELAVEKPAEPEKAPAELVAAPATDTPALEAVATTETPETTASSTITDEPPKTWRKEASAVWASLPSEVKAEVLKREGEIFRGIEMYKADAGFGKQMKGIVAPYESLIRANGVAPEQAVQHLLRTHYTLGTGTPEQRRDLLISMGKSYGIDLSTPQAPAGEPPYIDPTVAALQKKLESVESILSRAQQKEQQAAVTAVASEVDKFASDSANTHFNEVANHVATLIRTGVANTLQEAYEQAVWANPSTRAKELARQAAAANSTPSVPEAVAKVAAVKKATSANVQTRAKSGRATTPLGSLDDTLSETLAKIKAR